MDIKIENDHNIDYDPEFLSKIKELIKEGFDKLKSFVKSKKESRYKFYYELEEKLNQISNLLRSNEFFKNEFNFHLLIKSEILYIVNKN
ncbi:hypothetical protein [uncultured Methanobrevibacter sp.]|uniref:hypothetical protein n=1 Tax=uncultured Methanobrevibacter sp. TaxID=253161 RepID=UPI002605A753|nr:hypothetical protein [uncultured Methanobrevibacter sp.]